MDRSGGRVASEAAGSFYACRRIRVQTRPRVLEIIVVDLLQGPAVVHALAIRP